MFKLILKYLGKYFNKRGYKEGDKIRADVFPQPGMLGAAISAFLLGALYGFFGYYNKEYLNFIVTAISLVFSIAMFLYWKNYKIKLITTDRFEYTNMFGKKREYVISQMTRYRRRNGNHTLYFEDKKVPIDNVCYISEQFEFILKTQVDSMIILNSPEKAESSSGPAVEKDKDQDIDLLKVYD